MTEQTQTQKDKPPIRWRSHIVILTILVLFLGPVVWFDYRVAISTDVKFGVSFAGAYITLYVFWLLSQGIVSTGLVWGFRKVRPLWLHILSVPLAGFLMVIASEVQRNVGLFIDGLAEKRHIEARTAYADAVRLVRWKMEPEEGAPKSAKLTVSFGRSGLFGARLYGWDQDEEDIFSLGELDPAIRVKAGDEVDVEIPLTISGGGSGFRSDDFPGAS